MKKFSVAALGLALMAFSASAADYTLTPAEGWPGAQLDGVTLSYNDEIAVVKTDGTYVTYQTTGSASLATNVNKGMELKADGNNLKLGFTRNGGIVKVGSTKPFASMASMSGGVTVAEGDMTFRIEAGAFTIGGTPNEEISFTYKMSLTSPAPDFSYELSLAEGWQKTIGKTITLTFKNDVVATNDNLEIYCNTANGYSTFATANYANVYKSASGNVLTLNTGKKASVENTSGTFSTTSPKVTAGDYFITIPAGSYTVSGEAGPEIKLSYYLANNEPVFNFNPTFTPAADSSVEEVGTIEADFGAGANVAWAADAASKISLYKVDGALQNCNINYTLSASGTKLTLVPDKTMTEVNKYELTIGAGAMTNNGKANTEDIKVTYTIDTPPLPEAEDFAYTVNPLTDSWYTLIKEFTLTFDTDKEIELYNNNKGNVYVTFDGMNAEYDGSDPSKCYWFANGKAGDNVNRVEGNKVYFISTSGVEAGKATLYDIAGDFKSGYVNIVIREATLLIGGVPNKEIVLKYYIAASEPDFMSADVTPEVNTEIATLDKVELDYWAAKNVVKVAEAPVAELKYNDEVSEATATLSFDNNVVTVEVAPAQTAYGAYQLTIPAGLYTVDGLYNDEIVLNYSIIAPRNFEPTFDPEAGSMVEELGTITANFGAEAIVSWTENAADLVSLVKTGDEPVAVDVVYTLTAEDGVLTLTPDKTITEEATYELTIKAGAMVNNNKENPEDIVAQFIVGTPAPNTDFIPADPTIEKCYVHQCSDRKNEEGQEYLKVEDYGFIEFVLNNTYTANDREREYAASAMSYRILINDIETPYIFQYIPAVTDDNGEVVTPARFPMLQDKDPMEWVPGDYTNWEFPVQTTEKIHRCFLYGVELDKVERVGVQSRGLFSEVYYPSEVTWTVPTLDPREENQGESVNGIVANGIESIEYYDLQGCKVDASAKGLLIKRTISADGRVSVSKVIK